VGSFLVEEIFEDNKSYNPSILLKPEASLSAIVDEMV